MGNKYILIGIALFILGQYSSLSIGSLIYIRHPEDWCVPLGILFCLYGLFKKDDTPFLEQVKQWLQRIKKQMEE